VHNKILTFVRRSITIATSEGRKAIFLWSDPMAKKANGMNNVFDFDPTKFMGGFDPAKVMGDFDPSKMMNEFNKAMTDLKVPAVDAAPLMEAQRKNMEALAAANKLALEGVQAVFKRQAEILQKTLDELQGNLKDVSDAGSPQDAVAKQADIVKAAFETALGNMRELAEMVSKSNTEAFDTVNKRFGESLEELKDQVLKLKQ